MTTIQLIDQHKDILFYGFIIGIFHIILTIHKLINHEQRQKLFKVSEISKGTC